MAKTLLLAASDPNSTYLLRRYAEQSGFEIAHTSANKDVLALARRIRPAAIILETGLPGMMDWSLLQALKAHKATCRVPVLVYWWAEEDVDDQAQDVAGYLQHPVLYEDFLAALTRVGVQPPCFSLPDAALEPAEGA
jgi:DNA-binding response OmpR family regulator